MWELALFCGIVGLASSASVGFLDDPCEYLKDDGSLAETLTLKVGQSGFAGVTGTLWTIEPSGRWTAAKFLDTGDGAPRLSEPHARGTLNREQLSALARTLSEEEFRDLPDRIGKGPPVNPYVVTITFGSATSTTALAPGTNLAKAAAPRNVSESDQPLYARFLTVARALERSVAPAEVN